MSTITDPHKKPIKSRLPQLQDKLACKYCSFAAEKNLVDILYFSWSAYRRDVLLLLNIMDLDHTQLLEKNSTTSFLKKSWPAYSR